MYAHPNGYSQESEDKTKVVSSGNHSSVSDNNTIMESDWNADRHRYYGVRVGDTISYPVGISGEPPRIEGVVCHYGLSDNNCVFVLFDDKDRLYLPKFSQRPTVSCVAEWCRIVKRVEDKDAVPKNHG